MIAFHLICEIDRKFYDRNIMSERKKAVIEKSCQSILHNKTIDKIYGTKRFKKNNKISRYLPSVNLSLRCRFSEAVVHICFSK